MFEKWLQDQGKAHLLLDFLESDIFSKLSKERKPEYLNETIDVIDSLCASFDEFGIKIRGGEFGPMTAFWQSSIGMVQVLLDFIKAIRIGNCDLHLQSCEPMLVWMHAYDPTNYSRHFTYYWISQQKLQTRFPLIYQELEISQSNDLVVHLICWSLI